MSLKNGDKIKVIYQSDDEDNSIVNFGEILTVESYDGINLRVKENSEIWSYPDVHFFEAL